VTSYSASQANGLLQQLSEIGCLRSLKRHLAAPEDACRMRPFQSDCAVLHPEHRSFPQANHGCFVLFEELCDAFFLRFPHVGGRKIWIEIVRANLEGD
jgi:hypothetical protein